LALALTAKLRDDGERLPAAIVCMSAWTDLAGEGESYVRNKHTDPLFGIGEKTENLWIPLLLDYAGNTDLKRQILCPPNTRISMIFPPMLLQVGTQEILESDTEVVYEISHAHRVWMCV
jgi:acetyl esterase/lipase